MPRIAHRKQGLNLGTWLCIRRSLELMERASQNAKKSFSHLLTCNKLVQSTSAVELDTLERETCNSPTNYPAEVLHYSNTVPVQDHSVLPSIREDAYEVSDGQGEARQEHTKQHLAQGPDPSPLPNDVSPENLAENPCESSSEAPDHSQPTSLGGPTAEIHNDCEFTLEQEPSLVSSSANVHLVTDEERDLEDTQQHQSENHEVVMLVDGDTKQHQLDNHEVIQDTQQHQSENHEVVMLVDGDTQEHRSENHQGIMLVDGDTKQHQLDNHEVIQDTQQHQSENHEVVVLVDGNTQQHQSENHDVVTFAEGSGDEPLDKQCSEETFVSSVPVPDEAEKAQSSSSLEFDQVQFALGLDEKENTENSLIVATAKRVVADGSELVMSDSSSPSIPLTPATNAQDNSTKRLSGPGSSNIPVTPAVNVQVYSAKRLSGPGSFNIPATPVAKGQDSSNKRLSGPGSFSIPVTPLANAQDNSAKRLSGLRSSNISMTPPTNAQQNTTKYLSVPTSSDIPVTPVTKLKDNSDSALANAATPLTKIQSNIDSTLAKATSILEKLAAWRADAEKKMREGYWEPKFSTVVEGASAGPEVERPLAKTVPAVDRDVPSAKKARPMPKSIVDRDVPSAKKARPIPKSIVGPEKPLTVCEDTDIVSKGDMPSAKKLRISDDLSEVSDKENQSDKSIDSDKSQRRMGGIGKEKKKGKKFEVLKDRSKNLPDHGNGLATIKERTGLVRPGDMSLRKLRAQVKQKVSQLETSKASPLRPQKAWNMSH
ncbi:hypothetical protein M758_3G153400 [Ceratodon purpureus]|nr:hypothetical protein M758_3G153400 [Ceratodon purpureus]